MYGENGGLEWQQQEPNTLLVKWLDKPMEVLRAGANYTSSLSSFATHNCRTPGGHPEGYLEAFANIYRAFSRAVRDYKPGKRINPAKYDFPDVEDGVRGMNFVKTAVKSSMSMRKWTTLK